jgi:hypothetical protein
MSGMTHVQPKHIRSGTDQSPDHLGSLRSGTESCDDFGFAETHVCSIAPLLRPANHDFATDAGGSMKANRLPIKLFAFQQILKCRRAEEHEDHCYNDAEKNCHKMTLARSAEKASANPR